MRRVGRPAARHIVAWAFALLLAACGYSPQPRYVQTLSSVTAFALFESIQAGERGDLPGKARAVGLVDAGVCQEVGGGRLYCNALRLTETEYYGYPDFGPVFDLAYQELRFCLAPSRAVGFRAFGTNGSIPVPLLREYPAEFASILGSPGVEVQPDPSFAEDTFLSPDTSLTELSFNTALRRLGYGEPGSRFVWTNDREYVSVDYPGHAPGRRACRTL